MIEDAQGQRLYLAEDDHLVGVYGNTYATEHYEGIVPRTFDSCALLGAAGVCGALVSRHALAAPPTALEVVGQIFNADGARLNLSQFALCPEQRPVPVASSEPRRPTLILVAGSGMSSGKTMAAASLIRGLTQRGIRVAAGKVTGTASGYERWRFEHGGAVDVFDFSDCGLPGTYRCDEAELLTIYRTLYHKLCASRPDVMMLELGDGLLQPETAALLGHAEVQASVDHLIFAATDSLSMLAGEGWLASHGYTPLCLTGLLTTSPLAMREALALTNTLYFTRDDLICGEEILPLLRLPPPGQQERSLGDAA